MTIEFYLTTREHTNIQTFLDEITKAGWTGIATCLQCEWEKHQAIALCDFSVKSRTEDFMANLLTKDARILVGADGSLRDLRSETPYTIQKGASVAVWKK